MYTKILGFFHFPFCLHFRVIGIDIEQWKLDLAQKLGTDIVANSKEKDIKQVRP